MFIAKADAPCFSSAGLVPALQYIALHCSDVVWTMRGLYQIQVFGVR